MGEENRNVISYVLNRNHLCLNESRHEIKDISLFTGNESYRSIE